MQERDLDLFILEELHSNTDFQSWFAERIGLRSYMFRDAKHSVSAKIDGKWGETDILSFYEKGGETVAVLIEDKIAAAFADRQTDRYHDRAADLIRLELADRYITLLVAPSSYFKNVPQEAIWDKRLSIEEIRDWFAAIGSNHTRWREQALTACLDRIKRSQAAGKDEYLKFSEAFANFLQTQPGAFSHAVTGDSWGFIVAHSEKRTHVQLAWKTGKSRVDLTFTDQHVGKAKHIELPAGVGVAFADGISLQSDILGIDVPVVDVTAPLEEQADVLAAVMAALRELSLLVPVILAQPNSALHVASVGRGDA
jgi:hypothetical protein